jgi:hypothetical protein
MKIFFTALCTLLLLCGVATGQSLTFQATLEDEEVASPAGTCPSYYADAVLSMDYENGLNACNTAGNRLLFADMNSDIGAYGETGQAMKIDDSGEYIEFTQDANEYVNPNADQTMCMKIWVSARLTNQVALSNLRTSDLDEGIQMYMSTDGSPLIKGYYETAGPNVGAGATAIEVAGWRVVSYSWEGGTIPNGDHSANPGDEPTPDDWPSGWEDDIGDLDTAMTDAITILMIGGAWGNPGTTQYYYLDEWALVGSYKYDCSGLF